MTYYICTVLYLENTHVSFIPLLITFTGSSQIMNNSKMNQIVGMNAITRHIRSNDTLVVQIYGAADHLFQNKFAIKTYQIVSSK